MGKSTDDLVRLAHEVSDPPARSRDGHAAHVGRAHLDGAAVDGRQRPRRAGRVVHRFTGRHRHRHRPRPGEDHRGQGRPHPRGARRGPGRDRRRVPGRVDGEGDRDARTGCLRPHRGRARGRVPRRRRARSTPTSKACTPPIRASCPTRAGSHASRSRRCSRWPRPAAACSRCGRSRSPATTTCRCTSVPASPGPRHLGRRGGSRDGRGDHLRRHPRRLGGEDHDRAGARPSRRRRVGVPRAGRRRRQRRHDRAERLDCGPHRHLVHGSPIGSARRPRSSWTRSSSTPRRGATARMPRSVASRSSARA